MGKRRIGVIGFGHLGQFLIGSILENPNLELAFVWNRSLSALKGQIEDCYILKDLSTVSERKPDLIVEVAHPDISVKYGACCLEAADYMIGSPTALADKSIEDQLRKAANIHGLYVPSGAFWGGEDIKRMADRGNLQGLKVTMKKHPQSFKLTGDLRVKNESVVNHPVVLYEGSVRQLCPLAPNNVNTMAAAAIAGHNLGFDLVQGCLIADPSLVDRHIIEITVTGPGLPGNPFFVTTTRSNPAQIGTVTGIATLTSFLSSMLNANGKGPGFHFC